MKDEKARTELFTVRLWAESVGSDEREWRGQVTHIVSGATRFFRDWSDLRGFMVDHLDAVREKGGTR